MNDLDVAARAVLIVVMVVAAIGKLRRPADLVAVMRAMGLPRIPGAAVTIGIAELACAALLVVAPVPGFVLALGLLAGFTGGLVSAIHRGARVACHCFGASATPIGTHHVVRNALLLAVAAGGLACTRAGGTPAAAAAGALLGIVVVAWDDVVGVLFASRA